MCFLITGHTKGLPLTPRAWMAKWRTFPQGTPPPPPQTPASLNRAQATSLFNHSSGVPLSPSPSRTPQLGIQGPWLRPHSTQPSSTGPQHMSHHIPRATGTQAFVPTDSNPRLSPQPQIPLRQEGCSSSPTPVGRMVLC